MGSTMMVRILLLLGSLLVTVCAEPIATLDRTLWPDSLASHPGFNAASRLEILNFASELMGSELVAPDEWPQRLGLPQVDMLAIDHYRAQSWLRLLAAFQAASRECRGCPQLKTVAELRQLVLSPPAVPARLQHWLAESRLFHARYLQEQLTLAAQFPHPSSEIATLTSDEFTGYELMDGEFLLSFDAGPTMVGGSTWRTTRVRSASQASPAAMRSLRLSSWSFASFFSRETFVSTSLSMFASCSSKLARSSHRWDFSRSRISALRALSSARSTASS